MSLPPRSLLALALVAVIAVLIAGLILLLARSWPRSAVAQVMLIGAIVVLTAIALWILFVWPAYWD